jgi:hydroxylysine kinase
MTPHGLSNGQESGAPWRALQIVERRHALTVVAMDLGTTPPSAARTLMTPAAPLPPAEAERLVRAYYGIDAEATRLAGETDDNFVLRGAGGAYFLKVAHPAEHPQIVDLHTRLLDALSGVPGVPVQEVIPSLGGAANQAVAVADGTPRLARLTSFLEGRPMAKVGTDARLRGLIGRTGARLALALRDFEHPAADWPLIWDLWQADAVRPMLADLRHLAGYPVLLETMERYRDVVHPALAGLRRQMVHNDLNGDNVLISEDATSVAGVIDFGDAVITQVVNDVASAMCNHIAVDDDPMGPSIDVLRGYHGLLPLDADEIAVLYDLIRLRVTLRIVITEWRAVRFPANRKYILRSTPRAWEVLARMPISDEPETTRRLMEASGHA